MNDARLIEQLHIHGITIAPDINDTANKNRITVEFWQAVYTPYAYDAADHARTPGKLIGTQGSYCGKMSHRFGVNSVDEAWPEIVRRAKAYQLLEATLAETRPASKEGA